MSDYDRIAEAISFIANRVNSQPTLQEIARHLHLSPFHFQRLFSRWAGVTPKRFLQVLTLERAKQLLSESKPLLEVSDSLGLSSGSRYMTTSFIWKRLHLENIRREARV